MRLADIPISAKLSAMLIAACAGVLITACAAFVIFDRISTIEAKESTLGVLTDTVGQTLVGPVAFRDEASTNTVLEKLAAEPTTNSAAVYVDDGQRMTAWTREGAEALPEALTSASAPFGSDLVITRPIASPEGAVGTLVVRYSTADVVARTWRFLAIAGFVLLVSILLASLAAGRLQRLISNPVTTLVDAADRVQKEADYSIRAPVHGKDELGKLAGAFNDMLAGIQARDADLIAHQEGLEATVAERTRDLDQRNAAMRLVLDNVDQGFVTLDANGQLSPERSAAFDAWFGAPEQGVGLAAHLAGAGSDFEGWYDLAWEAIREDFMPLEVSISQLPSTLERDGKTFTLGWQPLLDGEVLQGILVVVSDVTAELERERADQEQRELVRAFRATREDRAGFEGFFTEASRIVHNLAAGGVNVEPALMQRQVHTLKGNAGLFEIGSLVEPCHVLEDLLQQGEPPQQPLVDAIVQAWHGFERRTALFRTSNDEIRVPLSAWEALAADVRSGISGAALSAASGWAVASGMAGASTPSVSATRRVRVRNSISARKVISVSLSGVRTSRSSRVKSSGVSQSSCTSRLDSSICSRFSIRVSRRLGCLISPARSSSSSSEPNSLISSAAVLMPIPGAPGTLSTESPASACTSTTRSGNTPNFSNTPSRSMRLFFIASSISTPSPTSCIRSLSELMIVTRPPASRAWQASVAMMSSAS